MGAMLVRQEPTSASAVRRELAADLEMYGIEADDVDAVTLVASELVGNAIRHTGATEQSQLDISWTVGEREVYLCVGDPSARLPRRRFPDAESTGGRGLTIVDALSIDWGADRTPGGKRVWARVPVRIAA
jgi:anti-sigma regulatory factor (Ser/Thr protein kinase)